MKVTMTNAEIINRHANLLVLGKKHLPRKVCYAIARNITVLEKEVKLIANQIDAIADKYAIKDDKGKFVLERTKGKQFYTFKSPADATAYESECQTINEIEVDIDIFTVSANELDKCENNNRFDSLTPLEEVSLAWMLEYD